MRFQYLHTQECLFEQEYLRCEYMHYHFRKPQMQLRRQITRRSLALSASTFLLLLGGPLQGVCGGEQGDIDRCIAAIDAIKSYDVTFRLQNLQYNDPDNTAEAVI